MATVDLGSIKFNWRNNWTISTAYAVDDVVFNNPDSYVCITAHTSHASDASLVTSDSAYWNKMTAGSTTVLPDQTGQAGEFLQTDGTSTTWEAVDALPTQTGQAGEYLQTDGTSATWEAVNALPTQTGQAGEYLQTDGTTATWEPYGSTDVSGLQNDIAVLALHVTTHHSSTALNLPNTFIDQYQNDSGIDTTSTAMYTAGSHVVTGNPGAGLVGYANDPDTILLVHGDGINNQSGTGAPGLADSSSNAAVLTGINLSLSSSSVDRAPIGGTALYVPGNTSTFVVPGIAVMDTEDDFTIEFWVRTTGLTDTPVFDFNTQTNIDQDDMHFEMSFAEGGVAEMSFELGGGVSYGGHNKWIYPTVGCNDDTWHHYAVVRDKTASSWFFYYDGVSMTLKSGSSALDDSMSDTINRDVNPMVFFKSVAFTSGRFTGSPCRFDELRFSSVCRYPSGTTFVPNPGPITTATGNYTSSTETANATVSIMGIVVLYKNASGTATLDTDLIAEVSADGGTNWTAAPLTAAGTFSTGILIAKSNDITISNTGTAPKYRISFANQADGTKNTQVHGASLLY